MMAKSALTFTLAQLFAFCLFSCFLSVTGQLFQKSSVQVTPISYDGIMGTLYNLNVSKSNEYLLEFSNPTGVSSSSPAHITVQCDDAPNDHPVLIVLRQAKGVLSWQIPFIVGNSVYTKTSRILCPDVNYYCTQNVTAVGLKYMVEEDNSFYVSISSGSPYNITVNLKVVIFDNFTVKANTEYEVPSSNSVFQFTPSQPWYYQFKWPENTTLADGNVTANTMKSVVVKIYSHDDICMTMSIQSIACPVPDLERTVGYEGFRQTMDSKGGVTLTKEEYPVGFHIVFVVNEDDKKCFQKGYSSAYLSDSETRSKILKFEISETISLHTFIIALLSPIVVILSIYSMFVIAAIVCSCRPYKVSPTTSATREDFEEAVTEDCAGPSGVSGKSSDTSKMSKQLIPPDDLSLDEVNYDVAINDHDEIFRAGRDIFLSDLSRKDTRVLRRKSDLYALNLVTVAVFYALPVFQLMYSYQSTLQKTGNQDTCFYNFLCAYPYRLTQTIVIGDFNHVFSNIGYIALGILFMCWTGRRDVMHQWAVSRRPSLDLELGIPQHYGLFYALGMALIMEGFLSGMYHVCPNQTNFQFDTSFMYVIAVLCMVKLYQNRHPDINANAYSTFLILALIIFIGMLGIMEHSGKFFILFTVLHILMCLYVSILVYRMRPLFIGNRLFKGISAETRQELRNHPRQFITPNYPSRLGLLIIGNVANWVLVYLGWTFELKNSFGSYLLTVLLTNLVLYFVFYIVMKLRYGEKVYLEPLMYIIVGTVLWALSGVFFLSKMTSWASSPAESRHKNEVCNFLQFYDNHDIWHFLSAGSMFCTFMVLLTLDDDLVEVPRSRIRVF